MKSQFLKSLNSKYIRLTAGDVNENKLFKLAMVITEN